ncbi:unnamed protein product [Larinioides sclopetarius]|uniref:Uncharacterized protein n=1 Tax=Larinioides sclopetarius TaxID=280406 RepID=A0AAV2B6U7_9ARAC
MAECTISRCSHERRVFRKELHKWSKEILYILVSSVFISSTIALYHYDVSRVFKDSL